MISKWKLLSFIISHMISSSTKNSFYSKETFVGTLLSIMLHVLESEDACYRCMIYINTSIVALYNEVTRQITRRCIDQ
jgi:hypothetical protein